jgi:hypothetical protein
LTCQLAELPGPLAAKIRLQTEFVLGSSCSDLSGGGPGAFGFSSGRPRLSDVSEHVIVERCFAFDTARHLTIGGKYPGFLARPDRWVS